MRARTLVRCWPYRCFVLEVAFLLVFAFGVGSQFLQAQLKTATSGARTASAVGFNCTTDMCSNSGAGCASCIRLTVELPANAWVVKTHCYTTANYPGDYDRNHLHQVACGMDNSWSFFDSTIVVATKQHVLVRTTFHNRSHNLSRDARLDVDWQPFESVHSQIVLPLRSSPASAESLGQPLPRELVDEVLWSIAHEGCDVFSGEQMRPLLELRQCFAATQTAPEASVRINATPLDTLRQATLRAVVRSYDEYQIRANFDWVMDHEGKRGEFVALAQQKDYPTIRSKYKDLQHHNDKAVNALSAVSDNQIDSLVRGLGLGGDQQESDQISPAESASLTDHIEWTILYAGCLVFAGENILPSDQLRDCYLRVQKDNHNGEAWELLKKASSETIELATERAINKAKEQYPAGQIVNHFLIASGELDHFKTLIKEGQVEETRKIYASAQKRGGDVPYLLNALADSEIAEIVNQYRLDVEIPSDVSVEALESIATLVGTQKVNLTPKTTESALANAACGKVTIDLLIFHIEAAKPCVTLVQRAAAKQGLTISASGTVTGGDSIQLPSLPRLGVPTLVAFRSGVSANVAETTLSSTGTKFAHPQPARLIQPEHGTKLSADTVKNYGDNGLQWYASAIGQIESVRMDLSLTSTIRVGIVDAGVDTAHAKLQPFFWKLPVTLPDIPWRRGSIGYDYVNEVSDPSEDKTPDADGNLESHGTHVAGLVTARALALWLKTTIGALRLEEHIKVYSLKVAEGSDGVIPDFTFPGQALSDSLPNQIHLINLSLEGPRAAYIRDDIIKKHSSDTLLVVAAGNDQKNLNDKNNLHFNGTFRNDDGTPLGNVILVGALMEDGSLTPNSNRGDIAVQIAAPGNNIYSTVQGGGFGSFTGTSQAAPLVTSTAAILLAEHSEAYPATIKERILATCDWDEALRSSHLVAEGCMLNMAKAIASETDIIELVSHSKGVVPIWLRGTVRKNQFKLSDEQGHAIAQSQLQRIWFSDRNGNVRVAVQGGGHQSVGSSRVDLQACKLEYSIVSPK